MNKVFFLGLILLFFAGCSAVKINKTAMLLSDKDLTVKDIKILNPDETINDRYPVFSPDGSKIAFESDRSGSGNINLWIMDADGSNIKQLTFMKTYDAFDPAFSPDGKEIVFAAALENEGHSNPELWIMNIDGSNLKQFTKLQRYNYSPAWSPDGKKIAFVSTRDGKNAVWVTNRSGKGFNKTTEGEPYPNNTEGLNKLTTGGNGDWCPVWTPDGSAIVYASKRDGIIETTTPHDDPRRKHGFINKGDIWVVDIKEKSFRQLTTDPAVDLFPAISPDGSIIAFYSLRNGSADIWTMNIDGSNQQTLFRDVERKPKMIYDEKIDFYRDLASYHLSWSPDGTKIAFTHVKAGEDKGDIGIITLDILQK